MEQNVPDLIEYVQKADASFADTPFSAADGLVLSELAYIKWEKLDPDFCPDGSMTLRDIISSFGTDQLQACLSANEYDMLMAVMQSDRFGDMRLSNFVSNNDTIDEVGSHTELEQFAAMVFTYADENGQTQNYVSFRGTDNTLEGWCEDFNMAYDTMTNAQRRAVEYLNEIASHLEGSIRLGGHSKGGNNAMYAFLFCDEAVRDRIVKIHIYDSPGFNADLTYTDPQGRTGTVDPQLWSKMQQLLRGTAICPYDSIIGQLLSEVEFLYVATSAGIFADHDGYTWQLDTETGEFVYAEQSKLSKFVNELLDEWVAALPLEHRKTLVVTVWSWIYTLRIDSFDDLLTLFSQDAGGTLADLLAYVRTLPEQEQRRLWEGLSTLVILAADNSLETALPGYETVREKLLQLLQAKEIHSLSDLRRCLQEDPVGFVMELMEALVSDHETLLALAQMAVSVQVVQLLLHAVILLISAAMHTIASALPVIAAIVAAVILCSKMIEYLRQHWEELVQLVTMAVEYAQEKLTQFVTAMKQAVTVAAQAAITAAVYGATQLAEEFYAGVTGLVDVLQELGRLASAALQRGLALSNPLMYIAARLVSGLRQAVVTIDMARLQEAVSSMDALAARVQRMDSRLDALYRTLCVNNIEQGEGIFTSLANLYHLSSADINVDEGRTIRKKATAISELYTGYSEAERWALSLI